MVRYFLDGRHPGLWSEGAERLLGLHGPPAAGDLRRVLDGRHPVDGRFLPSLRPSRRRGGWDLMFSAPKSVSLLAAQSRGEEAVTVRDAHRAAVSDVMGRLEADLAVRRRPDGRRTRADGLVAAAFEHSANAAGEPHLHSHVLVANLSRSDGVWGAVETPWHVERRALGALYQLGLRHHLHQAGWELDWRVRPDGLADLADVASSAIRAASGQSRLVAVAGRFEARRRAEAQVADRPDPPGSGDVVGTPLPPATRASHRRDQPRSRRPMAGPDDDALGRRVEVRLAGRRSDFRAADVVVALAASLPRGCPVGEALAWADRFCSRMEPVPSPSTGPRWTTRGARRIDDELVEALTQRAAGAATTAAIAATGVTVTEALAGGQAPVSVLVCAPGRSALLAQAEVLAECRARWESRGATVAVDTPTEEAARRWSLLSGIARHCPGGKPDVLVVDQADRRTSSELLRLTRRAGAQVVFVEGGTMPRLTNPTSHGLMEAADRLGRHRPPPFSPWVLESGRSVSIDLPSGREAAEQLLARWDRAGRQPVLVGLGPEEVHGLNRAAVGEDRPERGPGRYRAGDRIVVVHRVAGLPPAGTLGTVAEAPADGPGGQLMIAWADGGHSAVASGRDLARLGFGYAVTPRLAAGVDRPLMVLGPAAAIARGRERVVDEVVQARQPSGRDRALYR